VRREALDPRRLARDDAAALALAFADLAAARAARSKPAGDDRALAARLHVAAGQVLPAARQGALAVDDLLAAGEVDRARQLLERTLLPAVEPYRPTDSLIPLHTRAALALAHAGLVDRARAELSRLDAARPFLSPASLAALDETAAAVAAAPPPPPPPPPAGHAPRPSAAPIAPVGRNAPCPCGSGLKYKKCHGA
jgi:hypothetical protein